MSGAEPSDPAPPGTRPDDEGSGTGFTDAVQQNEDSGEGSWLPSWHGLSPDALQSFQLDFPLTGTASADCQHLSGIYRTASGSEAEQDVVRRAYALIADALGMCFHPGRRHEPFGPMAVFADGRRSAAPSDFTASIDVLEAIALKAANPALKARMADLCCLLDPRRGAMASLAMSAYADVVECVDRGLLTFEDAGEQGAMGGDGCDHLRRALFLGLGIGRGTPENARVRQLAAALRRKAEAQGDTYALQLLSELDLQYGISADPADLGAAMETAIASLPDGHNPHAVVEMWRFASRAFRSASRKADADRCKRGASDALVRHADGAGSPMVSAHFLAAAIAELSGSSDFKPRKRELRHQLVDVQAEIGDEMSLLSQTIDLRDVIEETRGRLAKTSLLLKLMVFACLTQSPEPEALEQDAKEAVKAHPLMSLFETSHLDHDGKVIHRTPSSGFGDTTDAAIVARIAQAESFRRRIVVHGAIEPARREIAEQHSLPEDGLHALLRLSPAVPPLLAGTLAFGFIRFLRGDFVAAAYVLVPMLEAIFRHVLKAGGHDPTMFDEVSQTQRDLSISQIFGSMRAEVNAIVGAALASDIERVFLAKPGPHLRHAFAHGLVADSTPSGADAIYGVWLIYRVCVMPLVAYRDDIDAPPEWLDPV